MRSHIPMKADAIYFVRLLSLHYNLLIFLATDNVLCVPLFNMIFFVALLVYLYHKSILCTTSPLTTYHMYQSQRSDREPLPRVSYLVERTKMNLYMSFDRVVPSEPP